MNRDVIKNQLYELIRYGFVGMFSALSYFIGSNIINLLGSPSFVSAGSGWFLSVVLGYCGHIKFTYKVKANHKTMGWRYLALALFNLGVSILITFILYDILTLSYPLVSALVTVMIPLIAYPIGKFWVFSERI